MDAVKSAVGLSVLVGCVSISCSSVLLRVLLRCTRIQRSAQCQYRSQSSKRLILTYCTFFCVHSRSRCTSLAADMPSEKLARVFANLALACACSASNSRCFAFSSPDLQSSQHRPDFEESRLTFGLASPDSYQAESGCTPAKGDRSCNPASLRL